MECWPRSDAREASSTGTDRTIRWWSRSVVRRISRPMPSAAPYFGSNSSRITGIVRSASPDPGVAPIHASWKRRCISRLIPTVYLSIASAARLLST
jgi:hypothetical protein